MSSGAARETKGYRGYVTSRSFGGHAIPVPVQSLVLRDYCQRRGFVYVLPVNENIFPHSYLVLEGMIRDLSRYEGVLMCSVHMLPQRAARRRAIFELVLAQGCSMHFVLEGLVLDTPGGIPPIEELIQFAQLAAQAPIPAQVLA